MFVFFLLQQEEFFDNFLDDLLQKDDGVKYTAVREDGSVLTPLELIDIKDVVRG